MSTGAPITSAVWPLVPLPCAALRGGHPLSCLLRLQVFFSLFVLGCDNGALYSKCESWPMGVWLQDG
jgi:hypothetical protein